MIFMITMELVYLLVDYYNCMYLSKRLSNLIYLCVPTIKLKFLLIIEGLEMLL